MRDRIALILIRWAQALATFGRTQDRLYEAERQQVWWVYHKP